MVTKAHAQVNTDEKRFSMQTSYSSSYIMLGGSSRGFNFKNNDRCDDPTKDKEKKSCHYGCLKNLTFFHSRAMTQNPADGINSDFQLPKESGISFPISFIFFFIE